jgi:hypothetical protein
MSKAGEQIIAAASSGIGKVHFLNPFTGKTEEFTTKDAAINSMLQAAAVKVADLEQQIKDIKAFLVLG